MKSTAGVTTIAIDLAKDVFQMALADASCHIVRGLRLKRAEFLAFWANHAASPTKRSMINLMKAARPRCWNADN